MREGRSPIPSKTRSIFFESWPTGYGCEVAAILGEDEVHPSAARGDEHAEMNNDQDELMQNHRGEIINTPERRAVSLPTEMTVAMTPMAHASSSSTDERAERGLQEEDLMEEALHIMQACEQN